MLLDNVWQADVELAILLPQPLEYCNYKYVITTMSGIGCPFKYSRSALYSVAHSLLWALALQLYTNINNKFSFLCFPISSE
jgi:hypothetical protein